MRDDFAILVLTHNRVGKQITLKTLERQGYTGKVYLVVDDADPSLAEYRERYGKQLVEFSKSKWRESVDVMDNFPNERGVVFARNAAFKIASDLGLKYFAQFDDDYTLFEYRFDQAQSYCWKKVKNLDAMFEAILEFFIASPFHSIAMSQCGDFIGGPESARAMKIALGRKAMNTFFCAVDRPFSFPGRINEDVVAYTAGQRAGVQFASFDNCSVQQVHTQQNPGGLTELYLDLGTYVKSFYSVIAAPSAVQVAAMNTANPRWHHKVDYGACAAKIVREELRRAG